MNTLQRSVWILALPVLVVGVSTRALCDTPTPPPGDDERRTCESAVTQFLQAPTTDGLAAIPHNGNACFAGLKTKQLQSLDALVAGGSEPAARLLAPHVRHLDGGELEDALRAIGQFAAHAMADASKLCLSGALTEREFRDALTMLPSGLEDNFAGQLAELKTRRAALQNLTDPGASELKKRTTGSIDQFISEVERAQSENVAPRQ